MRSDRYTYLYRRYLNGHCTKEEFEEIKRYFSSMEKPSSLTTVEDILSLSPENLVLDEEHSEKILKYILRRHARTNLHPIRRYAMYIAAAIILIAGFMVVYYSENNTERKDTQIQKHVNTDTDIKRILLKDGSSVYLKPGTTVTLLTDFENDIVRNIILEGEAFFAVAHNKYKPFVVRSPDGIHISVLGTRFNAQFTAKEHTVVLTEGAVQVIKDRHRLLLKPEEMVKYDVESKKFSQQKVDTSFYNAWITKQLYFKDNTLATVITQLNKTYPNTHLNLKPEFHNLQFTGYLPTDNIDSAIEILQKTFANHNLTIIKYNP